MTQFKFQRGCNDSLSQNGKRFEHHGDHIVPALCRVRPRRTDPVTQLHKCDILSFTFEAIKTILPGMKIGLPKNNGSRDLRVRVGVKAFGGLGQILPYYRVKIWPLEGNRAVFRNMPMEIPI